MTVDLPSCSRSRTPSVILKRKYYINTENPLDVKKKRMHSDIFCIIFSRFSCFINSDNQEEDIQKINHVQLDDKKHVSLSQLSIHIYSYVNFSWRNFFFLLN
jgi:hypothetical protein